MLLDVIIYMQLGKAPDARPKGKPTVKGAMIKMATVDDFIVVKPRLYDPEPYQLGHCPREGPPVNSKAWFDLPRVLIHWQDVDPHDMAKQDRRVEAEPLIYRRGDMRVIWSWKYGNRGQQVPYRGNRISIGAAMLLVPYLDLG